jgi:hypothetical protein
MNTLPAYGKQIHNLQPPAACFLHEIEAPTKSSSNKWFLKEPKIIIKKLINKVNNKLT